MTDASENTAREMKIQLNSDNTIAVDARLTRFVEGEVTRILGRFATRLTRVEIHLSDVDNKKTGRADKRCLIEVRPAGARPLTASATATEMPSAVGAAVRKMQRSLTSFFGRRKKPIKPVGTPASTAEETVDQERAPVNQAPVKKQTKLSPRGPKKKGIYRARRKAWPAR